MKVEKAVTHNRNASKSSARNNKHTQRTLLYGSQIANEKKKVEAERRRHQKAATLRNYAKLCKREGIQSNRVKVEGLSSSSHDNLIQNKESQLKSKFDELHKPRNRTDNKPLPTEIKKDGFNTTSDKDIETTVATSKDGERNAEEARLLAENKRKERQNRSKQMMKRTRSGQPVLHHRIQIMLEKLQQHDVSK